jgi:hypothetical protein
MKSIRVRSRSTVLLLSHLGRCPQEKESTASSTCAAPEPKPRLVDRLQVFPLPLFPVINDSFLNGINLPAKINISTIKPEAAEVPEVIAPREKSSKKPSDIESRSLLGGEERLAQDKGENIIRLRPGKQLEVKVEGFPFSKKLSEKSEKDSFLNKSQKS